MGEKIAARYDAPGARGPQADTRIDARSRGERWVAHSSLTRGRRGARTGRFPGVVSAPAGGRIGERAREATAKSDAPPQLIGRGPGRSQHVPPAPGRADRAADVPTVALQGGASPMCRREASHRFLLHGKRPGAETWNWLGPPMICTPPPSFGDGPYVS